jgi:hypothetical protein
MFDALKAPQDAPKQLEEPDAADIIAAEIEEDD